MREETAASPSRQPRPLPFWFLSPTRLFYMSAHCVRLHLSDHFTLYVGRFLAVKDTGLGSRHTQYAVTFNNNIAQSS